MWCYYYANDYTLMCDNDSSGQTNGHSGPDGNGTGVTLATGHGSSIPNGGTGAIYRLLNFSNSVHLYTISLSEAQTANNSNGFNFEQVEAVAPAGPGAGVTPLYRASNNTNGDFLYTTSYTEASTSNGYTYNGVAFYIFTSSASGRCPLYRLYDNYNVIHYYTVSPHEWYAAPSGVNQEGIIGYVSPLSGYSCPN